MTRKSATRRPWSADDDALVRARYPDQSTAELAQQLGRTLLSTYQRAQKLGLAKTAAYLASPAACRLRRGDNVGAAHRFTKGHEPANKGLRRPGWGPGRMKETQFRKGERTGKAERLYKPIGTERVSKDGYLERKINDSLPFQRRWRAVHLLVWEAAHGPLPAGHAVAFLNGDKSDVRLENLELITRRELMRRNTVHNLPAPLPQTIQLLGALNRKINRRARTDEEQDRGPAQSPVRDAGIAEGSGQADGARSSEGDRRRRACANRVSESRGVVPPGDEPDARLGVHPRRRGRPAATATRSRSGTALTHRAAPSPHCVHCGTALVYQGRGRPPKYCASPCVAHAVSA